MDWLIAVYTVLLLFAVALIILVWFIVKTATRGLLSPPRKIGGWTPRDVGLEYEELIYETTDGVKLKAWFVKKSSDKAVILIHGYTSSKWDEVYMKPALSILAKAGYSVLVPDMRAHGDSGGDITTLGYLEARDVAELVNYLRKMGYEKICLYGFSMGGAISLMVASKGGVDAVVLDSPYVSVTESGRRWINRVKGPLGYILRLTYPLIVRRAARLIRERAGEEFGVEKLIMYSYARYVKSPVLLIAPLRDDLISSEEYKRLSEELKAGSPLVETWFVDTDHVHAVRDYPREYEEKVLQFLAKTM